MRQIQWLGWAMGALCALGFVGPAFASSEQPSTGAEAAPAARTQEAAQPAAIASEPAAPEAPVAPAAPPSPQPAKAAAPAAKAPEQATALASPPVAGKLKLLETEKISARVGGFVNPLWHVEDNHGKWDGRAALHRARLLVGGRFVSERVKYMFEMEMTPSPRVLFAYLDFEVHKALTLRFGQTKTPIAREFYTQTPTIHTIDYSLPTQHFMLTGAVGLLAYGHPTPRLLYQLFLVEGPRKKPEDAPMYRAHGRVVARLLGAPASLMDPMPLSSHALKLDVGLTAGRIYQDLPKDGLWGSYRTSAELLLQARGAMLQAEYFWLRSAPRGDLPVSHGDGAYLLAGYFVVPEKLELIGRLGQLRKSVRQPLAQREATVGANWYLRGHDIKLMAGWNRYFELYPKTSVQAMAQFAF